jgi:hypothetical protein
MSIVRLKEFLQARIYIIKKINMLVCFVYIFIIIIFLLIPLILGYKSTFIGNLSGDAPQFIWQSHNLLSVITNKTTILDTSFFGVDTPYAYTPLSIVQISLFLLLKWVTKNQYIAFNLSTGIFLFLNFSVMYFVLRKFWFSKYTSLLFAVIFALSPAAMYHAANHISLFIIFPIPLFIFLLFKLKDNLNTKNFVSLGLLYSLTFYIHEYYALLLTLFGIVFILFYSKEFLQFRLIKKIVLTVFMIAVLLIPFYKFFHDKNTFDKQHNITNTRDPIESNYYSSSPLSFISPSTESFVYSRFHKLLYQHAVPSEQLHYFGFLTILLLLIALIHILQGKLILWEAKRMYFFAVFILSIFLSFGPYMIINYGRIPFPVLLGFHYEINPFNSLRAYGRFGIGAFTLAIFFGAYYYEKHNRRYKIFTNPFVISGLILFSILEIYPIKYIPRYKIEIPISALGIIKNDTAQDLYVASIPFQMEGGPLNSNSMLYQTFHSHKIVNGYSSFKNPLWEQKIQKSVMKCFTLKSYASSECKTLTRKTFEEEHVKYLIFEKFTEVEIPGNILFNEYRYVEHEMYKKFEGVIQEKIYNSDRIVIGKVY